jgi:hypothetical protein
MGNTMKRPACAGRDDDRSYSEGGQPSTLFPSTLALPLEEAMRLVLNVIWLIFGGLWLAPAHRHHPVWIRSVAHRILCAVAVRANDHRQARRRYRRADREDHLAALCGIWLAIGHLVSAVAMVPLIAHPHVGCEPFLGHLPM